MKINNVTSKNYVYDKDRKVAGSKKKSYQDSPLYTPKDFIDDNFHGLSFGRTMKELWKYVKQGANFLKTKALHVFKIK
jgi:hypothetical protein